jgi:hypothetical protein
MEEPNLLASVQSSSLLGFNPGRADSAQIAAQVGLAVITHRQLAQMPLIGTQLLLKDLLRISTAGVLCLQEEGSTTDTGTIGTRPARSNMHSGDQQLQTSLVIMAQRTDSAQTGRSCASKDEQLHWCLLQVTRTSFQELTCLCAILLSTHCAQLALNARRCVREQPGAAVTRSCAGGCQGIVCLPAPVICAAHTSPACQLQRYQVVKSPARSSQGKHQVCCTAK